MAIIKGIINHSNYFVALACEEQFHLYNIFMSYLSFHGIFGFHNDCNVSKLMISNTTLLTDFVKGRGSQFDSRFYLYYVTYYAITLTFICELISMMLFLMEIFRTYSTSKGIKLEGESDYIFHVPLIDCTKTWHIGVIRMRVKCYPYLMPIR